MTSTNDQKPHDPVSCLYCHNANLPDPEPGHVHRYDSAIGATSRTDHVLGEPTLALRCACGHQREIAGIIHPEPIDNPYLPSEFLRDADLYRNSWIAREVDRQGEEIKRNIFLDRPLPIPKEIA